MPKGNPDNKIENGISQNTHNKAVTNQKIENKKPKKSKQDTALSGKGEEKAKSARVFNDLVMKVVASENVVTNEKEVEVSDINVEQASALSEIKKALVESDYEVSDKFKVKLLEENTLEAVITRTNNLSIALKSYAKYEEAQFLKVIGSKLLGTVDDFDTYAKLLLKQSLFPRTKLQIIKLDLQELSLYKKSPIAIQMKVISFFASQGIDPTKNIILLPNVSSEFNSHDEDSQIDIINGLRSYGFGSLIQFLTHIDMDKVRINVLNHLRNSISAQDLYVYHNWKNPDTNLSTANLFIKVIKPACESFIQKSNSLENLLLAWPMLVNPANNLELSSIRVKFKSLVAKENHLAQSLQDPALPLLQDQVSKLREELEESSKLGLQLQSKIQTQIDINSEITEQLLELKKKRIESTKENLTGREAMEKQIKIDQLRELLPLLDFVSSTPDSASSIKALESVGIEVIGKIGQKTRWNASFCESLTGEEMEEGTVVRQGYTWFSGKEVIPLRRMLLKSE